MFCTLSREAKGSHSSEAFRTGRNVDGEPVVASMTPTIEDFLPFNKVTLT